MSGPPAVVDPPACVAHDPAVDATLATAAEEDQRDRSEWNPAVAERDAARLALVRGLAERAAICTPTAAADAAIVLQHSRVTSDHQLGFRLSTWAAANGVERARGWAGLAWDRALVSAGERQWYGTQAVSTKRRGKRSWCLVEIDPAATDADRAAAGMPPLSEKLAWIYAENQRTPPDGVDVARARADGFICAPEPWKP